MKQETLSYNLFEVALDVNGAVPEVLVETLSKQIGIPLTMSQITHRRQYPGIVYVLMMLNSCDLEYTPKALVDLASDELSPIARYIVSIQYLGKVTTDMYV